MDEEDFYANHLKFYFFIMLIGGVFIKLGLNRPTYDETTGEVIQNHWVAFLVIGAVTILLAFIGIIFFCDYKKYKNEK